MSVQAEKVFLVNIGHAFPPHVIPNAFFEELDIGSSAEWIRERTGIESRCSVVDPATLKQLQTKQLSYLDVARDSVRGMSLAAFAEAPWDMLVQRVGFGLMPEVLICGTSVPDYDIPANASTIAARLQLSSFCFDANSACSSFLTDILVAKGLLDSKAFSTAAIFTPERYSLRLDYTDRTSSFLFGDGSAAAYLARGADITGFEIVDVSMQSDASGYESVQMPVGQYFGQNGAAVQKFAIRRTCESTEAILQRNGLAISDVQYFIGHQANLRMLQSVCTRLGLTEQQHLYNVDRFGNQGAAGGPIVLSQNWDRFSEGDLVVMTLVGSGLTWGSAVLRFHA